MSAPNQPQMSRHQTRRNEALALPLLLLPKRTCNAKPILEAHLSPP